MYSDVRLECFYNTKKNNRVREAAAPHLPIVLYSANNTNPNNMGGGRAALQLLVIMNRCQIRNRMRRAD